MTMDAFYSKNYYHVLENTTLFIQKKPSYIMKWRVVIIQACILDGVRVSAALGVINQRCRLVVLNHRRLQTA